MAVTSIHPMSPERWERAAALTLFELFPAVLDAAEDASLATWLRAIGASRTPDSTKIANAIDALADDDAEGHRYRQMREIAELIHIGDHAGWVMATVRLARAALTAEQ